MKSLRNKYPLSDLITPFPSSCFLHTLITCLTHSLLHLYPPFPFSLTHSLFNHCQHKLTPLQPPLSSLLTHSNLSFSFIYYVFYLLFFLLLKHSEAPVLSSLQSPLHFMSSPIFFYFINIRTEIHLKTMNTKLVMLL